LSSAKKIEYRHHPFHGTEVRVVRTVRQFVDEIDIVQLPAGFQIAVPRWMLDPIICSQLRQEGKPRVALSALLRVADLLEKRHLPVDCEAALSDTSQPTKGHYVSRQKLPLSPNPVAPSQEDALGPVAGNHTHSVSSTPDPISAKGRAQRLDGKEQS